MPVVLYQIGDVPIFHPLKGIDNDGLEIQLDRRWKAPEIELVGVEGVHHFLDPARGLSEAPEINVSGTLVSESNLSGDWFFNKLASFGGKILTPIIAFRYEDTMSVNDWCCSNCNNPIEWLITYGVLLELPKTVILKNIDNVYSLQVLPVEVTIRVNTKWKRLPTWWWEYRTHQARFINPYDAANLHETPDNAFRHPKRFEDFKENSYFFKWKTSLSQYSPEFWGVQYSEGRTGGLGSGFGQPGSVSVYAAADKWNAPPDSMYAFTDLAPTGEIHIEVERQTGVFSEDSRVEDSFLDLSDLSLDLAAVGLTGLMRDDIIYAGRTSTLPGFIERNGERISTVRPRWIYPGLAPGEIGVGYNIVRTYATNSSVQVAYVHNFGCY